LRGHLRVLLMQITLRFDQFVLGALLEPKYLGWYSVAVGLSEGLQTLPDSVGVVLFPRVARDPDAAAELSARACRCTLLAMLMAALAVGAAATVIIPLLYGRQFLSSVKPLYLLLPAVVFQAASRVLRNYLYGIGRPHFALWGTGVAAVTTLAFIFPLVRNYGMVGAALTSLLAHAGGAVTDIVLSARLSRGSVLSFIVPRKEDLELANWRLYLPSYGRKP
jgi:O-antigen/teichoic acid export membrane protein